MAEHIPPYGMIDHGEGEHAVPRPLRTGFTDAPDLIFRSGRHGGNLFCGQGFAPLGKQRYVQSINT